MTINYTFSSDNNQDIVVNGSSQIDLDPNDFIDLSDEELKSKFQNLLGTNIKEKLKNIKLIIAPNDDKNLELFCKKIDEINKLNNQEYIYLSCESGTGDRDWYGDFNYLPNPLSKYTSCKKQCECYYMNGSGHGFGTAGIVVKTTEDFLKMMGWEDDLKYKCSREDFVAYKK